MTNEIEPARKVIEGEVITEKTPEQAWREFGEAIANLNKGFKAIADGYKKASGKPPIVIEDVITQASGGLHEGQIELTFKAFENEDNYPAFSAYCSKLWDLVGKRVRVTIEVLEDD